MRALAATAAVVALLSAMVGVGTAADFLIRHACAVCATPIEE